MRALQMGDLIAVARVLMLRDRECWANDAARFVVEAHAAHAFHKRRSKPHPSWGNGSLMARANAEPFAPQPPDGDKAFLAALLVSVQAIVNWRALRATPVPLAQCRAIVLPTEDCKCRTSSQS